MIQLIMGPCQMKQREVEFLLHEGKSAAGSAIPVI